MMRRNKYLVLLIAAMCILTGCGNTKQQPVTITHPSYEKLGYQTADVMRGDISSNVTLELRPEGYEVIRYHAPKAELQMELDEVRIAVGDRVKKGETLVSFEWEQMQSKIKEYEDEKKQKELLVQHYENLMKIDPGMDYEADIEMLREDIRVAQLYIEEVGRTLAEYQIVAKGDGIVTKISKYLQNGVVEPEAELLTQVTGTGRYIAAAADTGMFAEGESYTAGADGIEYEFILEEISDGTMIFRPVPGTMLVSGDEKLTLTLEMPQQKDVVYVNRFAVCTVKGDAGEEDAYIVYVMQEDGYQRAVFVTPGERIGNNIIIKEGLMGGEKVVIR